jgi:hypothetical protein
MNRSTTLVKSILLVSLLLLATFVAGAQILGNSWVGRNVRKLISDTTSPGKPSIRVYPTLAYAPETSVEFGLSGLLLFQARNDTNNRLSEVNAFTFITLKAQYGIWLDNAIYGHEDKWFVLGRTRFQQFPLLYYGIGPNARSEHPAVVDATYLLARQRVLRKIIPNLFFGPEVDYQQLFNTKFNQPSPADAAPHELPSGSEGTRNVGLGFGLVYDNRHNVLNVRKGFFGELSFLSYQPAWGSEKTFLGVNTDLRYYRPVRGRNVLAAQVYGNFLTGDVPFNQLALMGGEMMMRGYYMGRYRDKNMVSAQTEYRWLPFAFSKRFGGAVFAAAAVVAPEIGQFEARNIKWAGGAGLRYLLFQKKDIYLRFDVGATQDGFNFYIYTGEAF